MLYVVQITFAKVYEFKFNANEIGLTMYELDPMEKVNYIKLIQIYGE